MRYYNAISKGYDELHAAEQREKAKTVIQNCGLKGMLLDIGAGTGSATRLFEESAECVIALDPAKKMLSHYKGLKVVGRAEQLPFKEKSFDSIVSLTALHHADLPKAKAEINRVSKPSATIAISFFRRAASFGKAKALFSAFRKIDGEKDLVFVRE